MSRLLPTAPLRRLAWSGVAATAVVAVGGSLAGGAGESWTGWWTAPGVPVRPLVGVIPALALFYGGMILVCRCWSRLRAEVAEGAVEWTSVVVIFVLWSVPLVLAPPLASRDVYAYAASGEVAAAGFDPYEVGPNVLGADAPVVAVVDPQWRDSPSPYGPLFVGVAAAVARASSGVAVSVLLLRVLALAGLLLATWGLRRLAGPDREAQALAFLLCNPLVLLHLVSGAHNEALMIGLLVAGLAIGTRRPALGVVVCALAGGIKAPALLGVAYLGWTGAPGAAGWPRRALSVAGSGALAVGTLAVAGAVSGLGWGWLSTVSGSTDVGAYLSPTTILGAALGPLFGPGALGIAQAVGVLVAVAATVVLLLHSHRTGLVSLGTALVIVALLGPVVQPWYLAWGAAVIAAAASPERVRFLVAVSVGLCFAVLPAGPDLGRLAIEEPVAIGVALVALMPLALVGVPRPGWLRP